MIRLFLILVVAACVFATLGVILGGLVLFGLWWIGRKAYGPSVPRKQRRSM